MLPMGYIKNKIASIPGQSGQATFEYVVVVSFCVIVLVVPTPPDGKIVLVELANALKSYYEAFGFAISFSTTFMPL